MKKIMIIITCLLLTGCAASSTAAPASSSSCVVDPENNGYIKKTDTVSSATEEGKGLTYGYFDMSDSLKQETVLEYLKGNNSNYREMYQIATAVNNVPTVSSVEFVMDPTNFNLYALSEMGTEKTLEMQSNPNVSMYWTKQLRAEDEAKGMTYFASYGVQITGTAYIYTTDDLTSKKDELLHLFEVYYPTLATTAKVWSGLADDAAKIDYITKIMSREVVYKIVPSRIVVTQPYLLPLGGEYAACKAYTTKTDGSYAYPFVSSKFLDDLVSAKKDNADYQAVIDQMFPDTPLKADATDDEKKAWQASQASRTLLMGDNACGFKTQFILENFKK